jgi:L-cysteate sulfo-lyase
MIDCLARVPRVTLAHLPTPLERLNRLSQHLGGPTLFVKRDDCTGLGLGGNKVRKLEFLLADAIAQKATMLVSGGVVQSNSLRQIAAAAAKLGLECHLAVMIGRVPRTDPDYAETGNVFLDRLFGAQCELVEWTPRRSDPIIALANRLRRPGARPYIVPYGGSTVLGALGYVQCAIELFDQLRVRNLRLEAIVIASGTGGTQAGLLVGLAALGSTIRVIGIDIDAEPDRVRRDVTRLTLETAQFLGVPDVVPEANVEVIGGYAGESYGLPTDETVEAVELAARFEGLVLDPVYSGKGFAGLIGLVRARRFGPGDNVLFIHAGGAPALFAYRSFFAHADR